VAFSSEINSSFIFVTMSKTRRAKMKTIIQPVPRAISNVMCHLLCSSGVSTSCGV
jgi:hypothetical protein